MNKEEHLRAMTRARRDHDPLAYDMETLMFQLHYMHNHEHIVTWFEPTRRGTKVRVEPIETEADWANALREAKRIKEQVEDDHGIAIPMAATVGGVR